MKRLLLTLLAAGLASASFAEVRFAQGARPIPDSYIVVLHDDAPGAADAASRASLAAELAAQHGGRVARVYESALRGFSVRMARAAAEALSRDPRVSYVEQDSEVWAVATQTGATWGLDRIDQASLPLSTTYSYNFDGSGVNAYIIDTGIRTTHVEFGGRARSGFTAIGDGRGTYDCNGHGTHVSGTVGGSTWGVAKGVTLWAVRVLSCLGFGSNSGVIAGVDWVTTNHIKPAVANMSLGGGLSTALDAAVANSIAAGVTYAIAAGNSNANACSSSPARVATALTVGASNIGDARASFSNFGSCVDLFAPGEGITSSWTGSDTATDTISGTSMASPHVAGAAALYVDQHPTATPAQVASGVLAAATLGKITNAGVGSPNTLLFTLFDDAAAPCAACEHYTGTLSGPGALAGEPNGADGFTAGAGTHVAYLRGPVGTDFDLYLQRFDGTNWVIVARSVFVTSSETVTFAGTAGTYRWGLRSRDGAGTYDLWIIRP